jgi:hypothetical protein
MRMFSECLDSHPSIHSMLNPVFLSHPDWGKTRRQQIDGKKTKKWELPSCYKGEGDSLSPFFTAYSTNRPDLKTNPVSLGHSRQLPTQFSARYVFELLSA